MSEKRQIPHKVDKHRNLIMQIGPIRQALAIVCVFSVTYISSRLLG